MPKKSTKQENDNEGVGYCRPPKNHTWKKGMKSPNPLGRPPKKKQQDLFKTMDPLAAAFIAQDKRTLAKREGDRIEQIERGEAAIEKLFKLGMEGDTKALLAYLERRDRAFEHRQKVESEMMLRAAEYQERWFPKFNWAEATGKPVPSQLPHPADVVIRPDGRVDIVGPVTVQHQLAMEEALRARADLEEGLHSLLAGSPNGLSDEQIATYKKLWDQLETIVPPRLKKRFPLVPAV